MTPNIYANAPMGSRGVPTISRAEQARRLAETVTNRADREVLLSIFKWYDRARHRDETGRRWLVRTAEEFIQDGVLYTAATIRRALRRLAEAGIIIVKHGRHLFRKRWDQARHCTWIALSETFAPKVQKPATEANTESACGVPSEGNLNVRGTHLPILHAEQERTITPNRAPSAACPETGETSPKHGGILRTLGIRKSKKTAQAMSVPKESSAPRLTAAQVLAKFNNRGRPSIDGGLTGAKLHRVFARAYAEAFENERAGEPQAKHLKQWKDFIAKAREAGLGDEQICEAVEAVTSAWAPFCQWLQGRTKWKAQARPTPVFFYQQNAEVANYLRTRVHATDATAEPAAEGESLTDWLAKKGK